MTETDIVCIGSSQHGLGRRARAAVSQTCISPAVVFDSRASRSFEPILLNDSYEPIRKAFALHSATPGHQVRIELDRIIFLK